MAMIEYAEAELKRAGYFTEDSDYGGLIGPAVLEMIRQFAGDGHSGNSAYTCLYLFDRIARFRPLTPLENPMKDGSFIDVTEQSGTPWLQSTRLSTLFSEDGGKSWYDIDKPISKLKRVFGVRRSYVKFPYMP